MSAGEIGLPAKSLATHDDQISTPKPRLCDSSHLESLHKDEALLTQWGMPTTRVRAIIHNDAEYMGVNS